MTRTQTQNETDFEEQFSELFNAVANFRERTKITLGYYYRINQSPKTKELNQDQQKELRNVQRILEEEISDLGAILNQYCEHEQTSETILTPYQSQDENGDWYTVEPMQYECLVCGFSWME
jgi:hypothetical protein